MSLIKLEDLPLLGPSPQAWAQYVSKDFDHFLQDHAACERKAAALCMSFIAKFPDRKALIEPMISLAREEMAHFHEVYRLMRKRNQALASCDERDPYVNAILQKLRHGRDERFLDRLITSSLIEARGFERFGLLAEHLVDPELKIFYQRLAESELGHYSIFLKIAQHYFPEAEVKEALKRMSEVEYAAMMASPITARLH